ncbi:hypothetical protein FACS1894125_1220 [Actinomycetota bacterium]|nr:hypothetical protein FACS1894125_1220 [Actinomycetota bacterium]
MLDEEFGKVPFSKRSMFVKLTDNQRKDGYLDALLCKKYIRNSDRLCTFSLMNVLFKVEGANPPRNKPVYIALSIRRGIKAHYKDEFYDVTPISEKGRAVPNDGDSIEAVIDLFIQHNMLKDEKHKSK